MKNKAFGPEAHPDFERADAPVGEKCIQCDEPVAETDSGFIQLLLESVDRSDPDNLRAAVRLVPVHRECQLAGVVGHRYGFCRCVYPDLSVRERAVLCWKALAEVPPKAPDR